MRRVAIAAAQINEIRAEVQAMHPDDPDLLFDMLEAETDFTELMEWVGRKRAEAKADAATRADLAKDMAERIKRAEGKAKAMERLAAFLMDAADTRKHETHHGTFYFRAVGQSVVVTDEAALPERFVRVKREPNKTEIKAALVAGETVPGASLSNGGTTLAVRK